MSANDSIPRTALPIPSKARTGLITYDAKDPDTKFPPIEQLRPPKGAPNVLVILIDDVGFGASSAFGGPCQTPHAERLDGKQVGAGKVAATAPMIFSCDDGCDVGRDTGAPVSPDHGPRGRSGRG